MARGIAVMEESMRLDRTNFKALKMLDLANEAKKEKRVMLFLAFHSSVSAGSLHGQA